MCMISSSKFTFNFFLNDTIKGKVKYEMYVNFLIWNKFPRYTRPSQKGSSTVHGIQSPLKTKRKENTHLNVYRILKKWIHLWENSSAGCWGQYMCHGRPIVWFQLLSSYHPLANTVWLESSSEPRHWLHSSGYIQNQLTKTLKPTICQAVVSCY